MEDKIKRKVWKLTAGKLSNLELCEVEDLIPLRNSGKTTHVQVKITHIGINFADVFACLGLYSATPKGEFIPGLEFSGIVEDVYHEKDDENLKKHDFKVNDKVIGLTRFGAYSTRIQIQHYYLVKLPEHFGFNLESGASFIAQAATAFYGLYELGNIIPTSFIIKKLQNNNKNKNNNNNNNDDIEDEDDQNKLLSSNSSFYSTDLMKFFVNKKEEYKIVFIHSAAGGVGLNALNMCTQIPNIIIIGTVGREEKKDFLLEKYKDKKIFSTNQPFLSSEQIIVRKKTTKEFLVQVDEAIKFSSDLIISLVDDEENEDLYKKEGCDIIFDAIAGKFFLFDKLNSTGRYIIYGAADYMSYTSDRVNWFTLGYNYLFKRSSIDPYEMITNNTSMLGFNLIWLIHKIDKLSELLYLMLNLIDWEPPVVGKVFPFEDCLEALQYIQSGNSIGKVVLEVNHEEDNDEQKNNKNNK
eukprot:TRINITY_DN1895_c3_g1_i1.p1 TRINITY_DN1895_c3_g1~~TRINITY_DN1895_c3_g1_i1.p1  ORF type:complete len:467 (+),score=128.66 TRINITY_DN1895_c3_g1_i1:38-1438(+)